MEKVRPFDIVFFDTNHADQAMMSLAWLPGGEDERKRRAIKNHFMGWQNCPQITVDGKRAPGLCWCVAVNRLGCDELKPGASEGVELLVYKHCERLIEVEPGLIGGWIKESFWALPNVIEAAKLQDRNESIGRKQIEEVTQLKKAMHEQLTVAAEREYFETIARMVLSNPTIKLRKMKLNDLKNIAIMAALNKVKIVRYDKWMALKVPPLPEVDEKEYDPREFIKHGMQVSEACPQVRNNKTVK